MYSWGGIKVPFCSEEHPFYAMSIAKLWEGLKAYGDNLEIDVSLFRRQASRSHSDLPFKGFRKGPHKKELFTIEEAQWYLALAPYKKLLETKCQKELQQIRELVKDAKHVVLIENPKSNKPTNLEGEKLLSGAYMLQLYLLGQYPDPPSTV